MNIRTWSVYALVGLCTSAFGADFPVAPGQSIQAAIDAAQSGDRVLVAPGAYLETLEVSGKAIEIIGTGGATVTTIHATGGHDSAITLFGDDIRLVGFRITGGVGKPFGGFPFPKFYGGGIYSMGSTSIEQCLIEDNTTSSLLPGFAQGGGAYM